MGNVKLVSLDDIRAHVARWVTTSYSTLSNHGNYMGNGSRDANPKWQDLP